MAVEIAEFVFVFEMAVDVLAKLRSIDSKEMCLGWGLQGDLKRVEDTMSAIKDVLLDAEEKQACEVEITIWLTQLKHIFLDADDVLDELDCEKQRRRSVKKHGTTRRKVSRFFSRSNPLLFRIGVVHSFRDIRERLDQVADDHKKFDLIKRPEEISHDGKVNKRRDPYLFVDPSMPIGREDDKEKIIDLLINKAENSDGKEDQSVSVVPIVGVAGMGKSTLTRLVYNDQKVNDCFDLKMWVSVSKSFVTHRLIKEILNSATNRKNDNLTGKDSQTQLQDNLKGKRFLLVLDDVWNEDPEKWNELRGFLEGGAKGSKIIVTTHSQNVAERMGTISPYILQGLSKEHSLSLFLKFAFKEGQHMKPQSLIKNIAEQIAVDKCKGVPLALQTLGSLLYSNLNEEYWRHIKDTKLWELEYRRDEIFAALLLSYYDLPFHLKQCFLYCSLFPKGKVIYSLELIQLWMAHGILQQKRNKNRSLEDIGHEYFKQLWSRSFFQYVRNYGWYYSFTMHDLIYELAQFVAKNECSIGIDPSSSTTSTTNVCNRVRHLSIGQISGYSNYEPLTCLDKFTNVRTIIFPFLSNESLCDSFFNKYLIKKYEYLRMLDLSYSSFETLPSYIGRMKQLRSLNISHNKKITELPDSISKLQSLKSLQLQECTQLKALPRNIKNLSSSLVFLSITTTDSIPDIGIQCLTSLQTLMISHCNKLTYLPETMGSLSALKTLVISYCKKLALYDNEVEILRTLSLQKLILVELPNAKTLPQWLKGCEESLEYLCLCYCPNFYKLPVWLPKTTSLKEVEIIACPQLRFLPRGMNYLQVQLTIVLCPKLREFIRREIDQNMHPKILFLEDLPEYQTNRKDVPECSNSRQNRTFWTKEENIKLIQTILDLHSEGKCKVDREDNLKPRQRTAIKRLLTPKLPGFDLTTKHIKALKTHFHIVHEILTGRNSNGFGWDSEKKMETAENAMWDAYIQSHPEAMLFRDNGFPFYDEFSRVFGHKDESSEESESTEDEDEKIETCKSSTGLSKKMRKNVELEGIGEAIEKATLAITKEIRDSTNRLSQGIYQEINERYLRLNNELMKITSHTET